MAKTTSVIATLLSAAIFTVAAPVFAESAPVFDADSMQEQFENAGGPEVNAPEPPPPPAPSQDNAFVPLPPPPAGASSATTQGPAPLVSTNNMSLDKRVQKLEQQLTAGPGTEGIARLESLQEQMQSLRGQLEELTHQFQQLQTQQKALIFDVDKRLADLGTKPVKKALEAGVSVDSGDGAIAASSTKVASKTNPKAGKATPQTTTTVANTGNKSTADQPNVAEEQQIYQTAYNLIKAKKYNDAVNALQGMLKKYPSGQFAANAHYWLGELYGLMNKHDEALTEFTTVVSKYPSSPRISDAQLKVGLLYASNSNWAEAKTAFKKVVNHYPGTASARVASEQLKAIKQAGH